MVAGSWASRGHPGRRPDSEALAPETKSVQSCALSSIQRPAAFCFTIRLTGGGAGRAGLIGGLKLVPLFGGGLTPPYGPAGSLAAFGGKATPRPPDLLVSAAPPTVVASFPESWLST